MAIARKGCRWLMKAFGGDAALRRLTPYFGLELLPDQTVRRVPFSSEDDGLFWLHACSSGRRDDEVHASASARVLH
ncbi:hypothetical protein DLJ53_34085 [Acuticoccus sediminis]|uniref:Uncharacterized protein n=2 Tax=Acuticoccus sediminis TaxID=2184697 RepID=A0A8B2NFW6_9HYPH|nr:hypothetical protein DLJ53_34085 [Acuticoccus sediminis]